MHRFRSLEHCEATISESLGAIKEDQDKIEAIEKNLEDAGRRKKMKKKQWMIETEQQFLDRVERRMRERIVRQKRDKALKKNWRRPWDGVHGEAFAAYKIKAQLRMLAREEDESSGSEDDQDANEEGESTKRRCMILVQAALIRLTLVIQQVATAKAPVQARNLGLLSILMILRAPVAAATMKDNPVRMRYITCRKFFIDLK